MTDEEKKSFEKINRQIVIGECEKAIGIPIHLSDLKILINLIEKQTKEIEHQKEKRENQKKELAILNENQKELNKINNTVNSYKGQFKRQQKEIEQLRTAMNSKDEVINEILKKFKEGTKYYYSEFDYMNEDELKQYFINKVKENK